MCGINLSVATSDKPLVIKAAWLRHACLYMNLYGVPLDGPNSLHPNGIKLWDELQSFKYRLVVDNNSPWEKHAKDDAYSDIAFIVATTVLNERDQLLTLYEDCHGHRKEFYNVFFFGAEIDEVAAQGRAERDAAAGGTGLQLNLP
jgi:hypothetical protein